jgi:hypothetical protein
VPDSEHAITTVSSTNAYRSRIEYLFFMIHSPGRQSGVECIITMRFACIKRALPLDPL